MPGSFSVLGYASAAPLSSWNEVTNPNGVALHLQTLGSALCYYTLPYGQAPSTSLTPSLKCLTMTPPPGRTVSNCVVAPTMLSTSAPVSAPASAWSGSAVTLTATPQQPYEQLTAAYRRAGREEDAREIAIAKQRARRRTLPMPGRAGVYCLMFWSITVTAPG